ncbi:MAG: hypothetical protein IV100_06465 [Myxococcales bacterium]|nr:hypothetical protein [Myxococcales bacterium]
MADKRQAGRSPFRSLLVALLTACGGESPPGASVDVLPSGDIADVTTVDVPVALARGESCTMDASCASGRCLLGLCTGSTCTDCPEGWSCDGDAGCLPNAFWDCAPCWTDAECGSTTGRRCVPAGPSGERFCLEVGCSVRPGPTAACVGDATCTEVDLDSGTITACVPEGGLCACTELHEGGTTSCAGEAGCPGTRRCEGGAFSDCAAAPEGPELCDGFDNDCSGVADDDTADLACDDGVACTVDDCASGACAYAVAPGQCLIDGRCWASGDANPTNSCERCDPAMAAESWSTPTQPCDDGDPCSLDDACVAGVCQAGSTPACDDGLACTSDFCACDDCVTPSCSSEPVGDVCVLDGACVSAGAVNPENPCEACDPSQDRLAWSARLNVACDDGDACTLDDACTSAAICVGVPKSCDDGLPCTDEACAAGDCLVVGVAELGCFIEGECITLTAQHPDEPCLLCNGQVDAFAWTSRPDGTECGAKCYVGGSCAEGRCEGTTQICECFDDADCDDGDLCNGTAQCVKEGQKIQWHCEVVSDDPVSCDDVDASDCRVDQCNPATGVCEQVAVPAGVGCTDGNPCTTSDTCVLGECTGASAECDDDNPCTDDGCGEFGCAFTAKVGPCDDGDDCTEGDMCSGGTCSPGVNDCGCVNDNDCPSVDPCVGSYICETGVSSGCKLIPKAPCDTTGDGPCRVTQCDSSTGACVQSPVAATTPCLDDDVCTANTSCNGSGACVGGTVVTCDDGSDCTADTCQVGTGCTYTPISGSCEDGDPCSLGDTCSGGVCVSGAARCECQDDGDCADPDANPCTGVPTCDQSGAPDAWSCVAGPAVVCTPSLDPCLAAACDPQTGQCSNSPVSGVCNDGDPCTSTDACAQGTCIGQPYSCDDGLSCTADVCLGSGTCSHKVDGTACLIDGRCVAPGTEPEGNPCLICDPARENHAYSETTSDCDDGNACTQGDVCAGGVCESVPVVCSDGLTCTTDSCSPDGTCKSTLLQGFCLIAGACHAGGAFMTGNTCGACVPSTSTAAWTPVPGLCNDGNACTVNDQCEGLTCKPGVAASCSDNNPCTTNVCNPQTGCQSSPNTLPCDDGNECTSNDTCAAGACKGTFTCDCQNDVDCDPAPPCFEPPTCENNSCQYRPVECVDAGGECVDNVCVPGIGCQLQAVDEGKTCNSADECAETALCSSGTCKVQTYENCDDGNVCTDDVCDSTTGGCVQTPNQKFFACYDGPAGTSGVGVCKSGTKVCAGGTLTSCIGQVMPTAERCDGVDNNCNGIKDEGFALGQTCDGPDTDQCKEGVTVCSLNGTNTICQEGGTAKVEVCNDVDDDCDQLVDEGCDDDGDDYCDAAMAPNVGSSLELVVAACPLGDGDCNDLDPKVYPGQLDDPDLGFVDANCDGFDGDANRAIFVSYACGDDDFDGGQKSPVGSLAAALLLAEKYGKEVKDQIIIDSVLPTGAKYAGGHALVSGVGLYGGYSATWTPTGCLFAWSRSAATLAPIERSASVDAKSAVGLFALGLTSPTTLQLLKVEAVLGTGERGRSTYGLYVSGGNVVAQSCVFYAGAAAPGEDGALGGAAVVPGDSAVGGTTTSHAGGAGGAAPICRGNEFGYSGGAGATGGVNGNTGSNGSGSPTAVGGAGGSSTACVAQYSSAQSGKKGDSGSDLGSQMGPSGGHATHGLGQETIAGWRGESGSGGKSGLAGPGGGGGGSGAGATVVIDAIETKQLGGGGGGGGAGGCGGGGGGGGGPGGGSFAVYVTSQGSAGSTVPVSLTNCVLTTGKGGEGGKGGQGGAGILGRKGGDGRAFILLYKCLVGDTAQYSGQGGVGGTGGGGQRGGGGGGGAGGLSCALFQGSGVVNPSLTGVTFSPSNGGQGGLHGDGSGTRAPTGVSGGLCKP